MAYLHMQLKHNLAVTWTAGRIVITGWNLQLPVLEM